MLMDPRGSGKLVVASFGGSANDGALLYTVPEGRTFVGKILTSSNGNVLQNVRVNGVVVPCGGFYTSGQMVNVIEVIWPSNTVISAAGSSGNVTVMGNEI